MFRPSPCWLVAAAFASSLFAQVSAQIDQILPEGTPGAAAAADAVADAQKGQSECSCDCCQTTAMRQPIAGTKTTCGLAAQCPTTCQTSDPLDAVVVVADDGGLDYARYCQMTCLPDETIPGDDLGSQCREVTQEERDKLITPGGNGKDPATLGTPEAPPLPKELKDPDAPPEPPQLADAQAMKDQDDKDAAAGAGNAGANGDANAEKEDKDSGAMVAQAAGRQAIAAGWEARLTEAEASSAQSLSGADADLESAKSNALMITAAKAQVQAAEVRADIYAKSAQKAAARAEAELKEIMDIPKKAAALAAAEAKAEVQKEVNEAASNVAIVKARLAGPPLPVPLAEAAVRSAQPYYAAMNKAIAMGNLYEQSAHNLQDQAQSLQEQSREVASQAVGYQGAGYGDMASKLMAQAKSMLNEAMAKDAQAKKDFAVAEGVRKQVPNYQANAALASARATTIANPAGQPPAAMAPGFLQLPRTMLSPVEPH